VSLSTLACIRVSCCKVFWGLHTSWWVWLLTALSCVPVPRCCTPNNRGVVAVELEAADEARALLRRYLDTKNFGEGSGESHDCTRCSAKTPWPQRLFLEGVPRCLQRPYPQHRCATLFLTAHATPLPPCCLRPPPTDVTREDALALSRLYAVQLLSGLCGNFQAAADWLTDGGAGLSEEQQEVRQGQHPR
jgi:hypothetical protein